MNQYWAAPRLVRLILQVALGASAAKIPQPPSDDSQGSRNGIQKRAGTKSHLKK